MITSFKCTAMDIMLNCPIGHSEGGLGNCLMTDSIIKVFKWSCIFINRRVTRKPYTPSLPHSRSTPALWRLENPVAVQWPSWWTRRTNMEAYKCFLQRQACTVRCPPPDGRPHTLPEGPRELVWELWNTNSFSCVRMTNSKTIYQKENVDHCLLELHRLFNN